MEHGEILGWLKEENPAGLGEVFRRADHIRRERHGDAVHLRGLAGQYL
jgi:hypothetical protein